MHPLPSRYSELFCQEAVDQYLNRMASEPRDAPPSHLARLACCGFRLARLDSPLRKIAFGSGTPRVARSLWGAGALLVSLGFPC